MDRLIRYVCVAPGHSREDAAIGDLTVYRGSWAFCPAEAATAHVWRAVAETDVSGLSRFGLRSPAGAGPLS